MNFLEHLEVQVQVEGPATGDGGVTKGLEGLGTITEGQGGGGFIVDKEGLGTITEGLDGGLEGSGSTCLAILEGGDGSGSAFLLPGYMWFTIK